MQIQWNLTRRIKDITEKNLYKNFDLSHSRKPDPPFLVPPVQIYQNIWIPQIIYFNFAEIFGPPGTKFLKYLDLLEIFYPPHYFKSTHIA